MLVIASLLRSMDNRNMGWNSSDYLLIIQMSIHGQAYWEDKERHKKDRYHACWVAVDGIRPLNPGFEKSFLSIQSEFKREDWIFLRL